MKRTILPFGIILLILTNISFSVAINESNNITIIYVDDDNMSGPWYGTINHPFQYIQDGINAATFNDTVFVFNGMYHEHLIINKSISLMGESKEDTTIIDDHSHLTAAVNINSNYVIVSNFTIQGEAVSYGIEITSDYATVSNNNILSSTGVNIHSGYNSIVKNNIEADSFWGIGLHGPKGSFNTILDNIITAESSGIYFISQCRNNTISNNTIYCINCGIRLYESNKNIIEFNSLYEGGFYLHNSYDNIIINNAVNGKPIAYLKNESDILINQDFGQVILINCENITVENQFIFNVRSGIFAYSSNYLTIQDNVIIHNNPFRCIGINLISCKSTKIIRNKFSYIDALSIRFCNDTFISNNEIVNCRTGISLQYCNKCKISKNNIVNNSLHIDFYFGSRNSEITMNNLIGNRPTALFCDPLLANNTWNYNYWGRPLLLPRPIRGALILKDSFPYPSLILWFKFDWNPAKEPFKVQ